MIRSLLGHSNTVTGLAVDAETGDLYSASLDFTARHWSRWDGPEGPTIKFDNGSWVIGMSPDAARIFVGVNTRNVGVIDAGTLRAVAELEGHTGIIRSLAVARDGKRMFTVANDGLLIEWDLATYDIKRLTQAHQGNAMRVVMTPDQVAVATSGMDGTLKIWDAVGGDLLRSMTISNEGVNAFGFSPDGTRLVTGGMDRTIRLWDRASGTKIGELGGFADFITSVGYTPEGSEIIVTVNDGDHLHVGPSRRHPRPHLRGAQAGRLFRHVFRRRKPHGDGGV